MCVCVCVYVHVCLHPLDISPTLKALTDCYCFSLSEFQLKHTHLNVGAGTSHRTLTISTFTQTVCKHLKQSE